MELQDADGSPKIERVFKKMLLEPYNGRIKWSHLSKMSPEDFPENSDFLAKRIWFQDNADTFALFKSVKGKVVMVGIKLKAAKLCEKYLQQQNSENGCVDEKCRLLHLCTGFFNHHCKDVNCKLIHSLDDTHNKEILSSNVFSKFSQKDQKKIIKLSQPEICQNYNEDGLCNLKDLCTRLHICRKFILGHCEVSPQAVDCPLSHSLTSTHSLHLLQIFGIWYNPNNLSGVYCQILTPTRALEQSRIKTSGKFHKIVEKTSESLQDEPEKANLESSCSDGITASSKVISGLKCEESSPNFWSFEFLEKWFYFHSKPDREIENQFCDPSSNEVSITVPKEIQEIMPECTKLTLKFAEMIAILDDGMQSLPIRRSESSSSSFIYLWYYLNSSNQWEILDNNDVVEMGFKNKEKRINMSSIDGQMLRVKYSDMTLKDRNTGEIYQLRRRPLEINEITII